MTAAAMEGSAANVMTKGQATRDTKEIVSSSAGEEECDYPEGGYGWVVVTAGAAIFFHGWGLSNAWGIFQTYYETEYPDTSPSVISLIGSLQAAMIEGTGMLVGVLMEKYGLRKVMVVGAVLEVVALLATSFCTAVWQLYLAQGLAFGLGAGTLYIAAVAVPGQWFHKKKATAYGALYTSSGLGGVVWPIALAKLLPRIGFGWTVRVVMFISLVQILFGCCFLKERDVRKEPQNPQKSQLSDVPATDLPTAKETYGDIYRDLKLWYIAFGYFILSIGMLSPMFFIGTFARTIGTSDHLSFYLLAMLNASSIVGRVVMGVLADRYGRLNLFILSVIVSGLLQVALWSNITTNAGLIMFAILYGWFFGGLISLMPAISAQVLGQHNLATKFGVVSAFGGGGALLGAPVAAIWIGSTRTSYYGTLFFSGGCVLLSAAWYAALRLWIDRRFWAKV